LPKILKIILFIIFFVLFFEAGLISSYTIVTAQPPDIGKLIDMQINQISAFLHLEDWNTNIIAKPKAIKILNPELVAETMKNRAQIDGINLATLTAATYGDTNSETVTVNITAMGYKENLTRSGTNKTGGQIVIAPTETYTVTATATAKVKSKGVEIDVTTIKIISVSKIYSNTTG